MFVEKNCTDLLPVIGLKKSTTIMTESSLLTISIKSKNIFPPLCLLLTVIARSQKIKIPMDLGTPGQKSPNGRCTIENTYFTLPRKEGNYEILVGLANYFYGWGIIARLDDTDGIQIEK